MNLLHPSVILGVATVAFAFGLWLGARSKVWDWNDGYRTGRKDERSGA